MRHEESSSGQSSPQDEGACVWGQPPHEGEPAFAKHATYVLRPLLYLRHPRIARSAAGIARVVPTREPEPPVLGQAVLRDLAWLCVYLREVIEDTPELEPVRQAVLAFLFEEVPTLAAEWLEVRMPDEPLRWGYRVRIEPDLGDMLTRLVRSAVAGGDLIKLDEFGPYSFANACFSTMGELEWAIREVPAWRPPLQHFHDLAAEAFATGIAQ